jgi:hypothetical protein
MCKELPEERIVDNMMRLRFYTWKDTSRRGEGYMKSYRLLGADGVEYQSETPGTLGGNSKAKIYGRLDCYTARSTMERFPGIYEKSRVFFADEKTALAAGYRPCGSCMRDKYREYRRDPEKYRAKFGL